MLTASVKKDDPKSDQQWYAVYTRPQCEKRVHKALQSLQLEVYLPLTNVLRQWSDRKKVLSKPLFPSYLFTKIYVDNIATVMQTNGVVRIISFNGKPIAIPAEQIIAIRQILEAGYQFLIHPYFSVEKGDWVRVVSGSLQGIKGIVIADSSDNRLLIMIKSIGKTVSVNIEKKHLRPILKTKGKGHLHGM